MDPAFFQRLGLFVEPHFLSADDIRPVLADVKGAETAPATVGDQSGAVYVVDEETRRTKWATVGEQTSAFVYSRLLSIKPAIEAHFAVELTGCQKPQFLVYHVGDHFALHRDNVPDASAAQFSRERRIAAIIFLNDQAENEEPGKYTGGSLTFHGVLGAGTTRIGFPLTGRAGLLVAFSADVLHEVTPVTSGGRYTVASWFV